MSIHKDSSSIGLDIANDLYRYTLTVFIYSLFSVIQAIMIGALMVDSTL